MYQASARENRHRPPNGTHLFFGTLPCSGPSWKLGRGGGQRISPTTQTLKKIYCGSGWRRRHTPTGISPPGGCRWRPVRHSPTPHSGASGGRQRRRGSVQNHAPPRASVQRSVHRFTSLPGLWVGREPRRARHKRIGEVGVAAPGALPLRPLTEAWPPPLLQLLRRRGASRVLRRQPGFPRRPLPGLCLQGGPLLPQRPVLGLQRCVPPLGTAAV